MTQSFWDWPLWISIPIVISVPIFILWIVGQTREELSQGEPDGIGWTIGFGVATFLCALTTFDLWVTGAVFEGGEKDTGWLRVGYPIMTAFFGFYFILSIAKRLR
jgi:hypothetical protein